MSDWVEAEFEHRRYLQRFVCAEHPLQKLKRLFRGQSPRPDEWSSRIQGRIRCLKPRLRPPDRLTLKFDQRLGVVESVGCYYVLWQESGFHDAYIYLLAIQRRLSGAGYGQEALDRVMTEVGEASMYQPLTRQVTTFAEVHALNSRCKALLRRNSWSFMKMHVDGQHEIWSIVGN